MPPDEDSRRAPADAIREATRLLQLAELSVLEASQDFEGELSDLAMRMARHVRYLKEVSELVAHEMAQRQEQGAVIAFGRARLKLVSNLQQTAPQLLEQSP